MSGDLSYDQVGPYAVESAKVKRELFPDLMSKKLKFMVTYPSQGTGDFPLDKLSSPVVFFYSGFSIPLEYYAGYCDRLATWGYVVVQYGPRGLRWLKPTPDEDELGYFTEMFDSLKRGLETQLPVKCDWESLATAGHSRGAKLAVLLKLRHNDKVKTVFMIDPVDGSDFSVPGTKGYPDAVDEMNKANPKLAAGIAGNDWSVIIPKQYNYKHFWGAMDQDKSSSAMLEKANHMSFLAPVDGLFGVIGGIGDFFFGNKEEVVQPTYTLLVHWMETILPTPPAKSDEARELLEKKFRGWLTHNEHDGLVKAPLSKTT